MGIEYEEWLAELGQLETGSDAEGLTVSEIRERLGVHERTVRAFLRSAIRDGKWKLRGRKRITGIDGRSFPVPCYGPASVERKEVPVESTRRKKRKRRQAVGSILFRGPR